MQPVYWLAKSWAVCDSYPDSGKDIFQSLPYGLWGHFKLLFNGYRVPFPLV